MASAWHGGKMRVDEIDVRDRKRSPLTRILLGVMKNAGGMPFHHQLANDLRAETIDSPPALEGAAPLRALWRLGKDGGKAKFLRRWRQHLIRRLAQVTHGFYHETSMRARRTVRMHRSLLALGRLVFQHGPGLIRGLGMRVMANMLCPCARLVHTIRRHRAPAKLQHKESGE